MVKTKMELELIVRRQAMRVSIQDLRDKADELTELLLLTGFNTSECLTKKCQVVIVNESMASDTWKFEK